MSLSSIYANYVRTPQKERSLTRLFVSDVGKCPRQIAYRMTGVDKDPVSEQEEINKQIMFDLADHIEFTLWVAIPEEDTIKFQFPVPIDDRENWGGRGDIMANYEGRRVIEVKTLYPGAFRYEIDYPAHHYQAAIYDHYCIGKYNLDALPLLWYADRGGQNTPVEQVVEYDWDEVSRVMDELEMARNRLPDLPAPMEKELVERSYKKKLVLEPSWQCNRCDYAETCKPDMSTSVWAERDNANVPYEAKKAADLTKLTDWAKQRTIDVRG